MSMIQLLTKKRFRFKNPHKSLIKPVTVGTGKDAQTVQVESGAKFEDVYVEVAPKVLTAVPDWVRTDPIFDWGVKDGDILEVTTKQPMKAEAEQQKADKERAEDRERAEEAQAAERERLKSLPKVELLKYASDQYGLELSQAMNKPQILEAIEAAEAEKAEDAEEGDTE